MTNKQPHPLIEQWLTELVINNLSAHTLSAYRRAISQLANYLEHQQKTWSQLDRRLFSHYVAYRLEVDELSIKSMQQELSAIRGFYTWLIEHNFAKINPTTGYQLKQSARNLPRIADVDLLTQLLEQQPPDDPQRTQLWQRDKAMFELLYGSGLRVSELVSINVNDIDSRQKQLRVIGKGNKTRIVPITNQSIIALQNYLPLRFQWLQKRANGQNMALFISERLGRRLTTRSVQQRLKFWAKHAGIAQNLYPHLLRHCFASHLLSDSGDLRAIQEMLGHSDISTTQIYTQVDFGKLTQTYDQSHPRASKKSNIN
ncbi:MAG: tyrosine recombinase XerC [Moraxellaceae bacterium]|nr:tyrosine recombinase XerC [Moraxellaceae bacterium]